MYKLIDKQGTGLKEDVLFESKEEVRKHLADFHNQDYEGEIPLEKWTLEELLEYGSWDIVEITFDQACEIAEFLHQTKGEIYYLEDGGTITKKECDEIILKHIPY